MTGPGHAPPSIEEEKMRSAQDIKRLIKDLRDTTSADMDERVLKDVSKVLEQSERTKSALVQPNIWRKIMKNRITKLVAVAVIVIAVLLSITIFDKTIPAAYALEQTIEANRSLRFIH